MKRIAFDSPRRSRRRALAVHIMTNTALTGATYDRRRRAAARDNRQLTRVTG